METDNTSPKLHPLLATAAVALIIACLTGIAAMIGLIPNFNKNTPPTVATNAVTAPPPAPVTPPVKEESVAIPAEPEKPAPVAKAIPKKPKPVKHTAPPEEVRTDYRASQMYTPPPPCPNCGVVESVQMIQQQAPTSGVGAGVGALLGGVLGHQVGGGNGRTLATVAGAIGGGLAGNSVEKNTHTTTAYEVIVRMDDGNRQRFIMNEQRWRAGDSVRVDNGYLSRRNY